MSKKGRAENVIKNSVIWSMGAGLIPIPLADMVAVTAIQLDMIKQISVVYEISFSENQIKSWLSALSGGVLSRLGAGAIKAIPGIGTAIGGLSMAVLSGASTYATGQVFLHHFESGGSLLDFDVEKFKDFYKTQFEKGKAFVEDLQKDKEKEKTKEETAASATPREEAPKASQTASQPDIVQRLRELSELLDKGIITEDEFKILKEKVLRDFAK